MNDRVLLVELSALAAEASARLLRLVAQLAYRVVAATHATAHLVHLREQLVHALLALGELLLLSDREWRARQLLRRRIVLLLLSLALANDQRGR